MGSRSERSELLETFSVKLPPALLAELREIAAVEDRTVASLLRIAATDWLKRRKGGENG